jgi:hypothetical protein
LLAATAAAQYTSGIDGTVVDQSGSAAPTAHVVITNEATQLTRDTDTNGSGYFRVTDLGPGAYRVEVRLAGFQDWVQAHVQVDANQLRTVYPKVLIGEQKAVVEVSAAVAGIETAQSSVAASIPEKTVDLAPMQGRNIFGGVAFIAPGVTGSGTLFGGGGGGASNQDSFQTQPGFQINSAGQRQENNDYRVDGSSVNGNSRDGITNLTPEPDTVQEVRVSAVTFTAERGHNSGALIEVFTKPGTSQIHGTLSEFHTNNDLTARTVFQNTVPVFRRNEYGATIGGPVIKNRTFLFGSYFRLNSSSATTTVTTAETPQFLQYLQQYYPNNVSTRILTSAPIGSYPVSGFVTAGQLVSSSYFPVPSTLPLNMPVLGTSYVNEVDPRPADQWNTRLDQYIGDKDRIFFNYYNTVSKAVVSAARPSMRLLKPTWGMFGKVNWTHTLSPTLLNEASMTLVRPDGYTSNTTDPSLPSISVPSLTGYSSSPLNWLQANYNWYDHLSWTRGNHNLKFGVDADRQHDLDKFTPEYTHPTFTFANLLDFAQDLPLTQSGPVVDTRTGQLAQNEYTRVHMTYAGGFVQDDWKVNPRLTLNLGLRYEYYGHLAQIDTGGTPGSFFTPGSGSTFDQQIANGVMRTPKDGLVTTNKVQGIMPRIGVGWDVFGNGTLAVRGGWGIYYNSLGDLAYAVYVNPPSFGSVSLDVRNGQTPNFVLGSANGLYFPLPPGLQMTINSAGGLAGTPVSVKGLSPNFDAARVQVWNLTIQKRLTNSIIVEADYMGNHGSDLYLQTNVNRYAGDLVQHHGVLTRLNPYFGTITFGQTTGYSDANMGTFLVSKRFAKGFSAQGIFTFGKSTDLTSSNDNGVAGAENVVDAGNPGLQHGLSDFNVSRRLTIDSVYSIPSPFKHGIGSHVLGGWELAGIAIFQSGLPFSVYTSAAYPKGDYNADGYNYDFPNTPAFGNSVSASRSDYQKGLFSASAFPIPATGQTGNLGRNTFVGPGLANVNMNIVKTEHVPWFVPEGATFQLRGEIMNLFNRVNLTNPVSDLSNSLFGKSTAQNLSRSVTFGIRIQY